METIKEHLPQMLEEIQHCKQMAEVHLTMYQFMVAQCIREAVDPNYFGGYWTTQAAMDETYANYQDALARKKHLEWIVKNIKNFAKNT